MLFQMMMYCTTISDIMQTKEWIGGVRIEEDVVVWSALGGHLDAVV